ncbi:MAG TPA: hypothetical protein VGR02_15845 [Thermoanaerobaculia bacterium]|jgi:hypothetical protein|nr:hypothetical protein [Thermoanaerobaculia bacterium]
MEARRQLHRAAQVAAGVGRALLPPRPDFSHESFSWTGGRLVQGLVEGRFRSGLRFADLTLLLLDGDDALIDQLPLDGRTLEDGFRFYEERCAALLGRKVELARQGESGPFHAERAALAEAARLYDTADQLLRELDEGPIRCWPHHFDIATLIPLGGERTIGAGMSPGDAAHPEPYYYVTPWPYPPPETLPPLSAGRWNTHHWVGALLPAAEPRETIARFLSEAIAILRDSAR